MYCSHCGTALPDDARFCSNCGYPTEGPPQSPPDRNDEAFARLSRSEYYKAYSLFNYPYPYNYDYDYDYSPESTPRFRSYLGWNMAVALLCCFPFGLVGAIFSSMALRNRRSGNMETAWNLRRTAEIVFWLGAAIGSLYVLYFIVVHMLDPSYFEELANM